MFGRIVLALILLLVALFAGLLACAYDPGYSNSHSLCLCAAV